MARASAETVVSQPQAQAAPAVPRTPAQTLHRLRYYRDLTLHLAQRDFATKNRGSLLGWLWSLAPVLLQLLVTQRMLVLRPGFPTILVPVAAVIVPLLDYLLALPILLGALEFTSGVPIE